ncbi:amino-acid N-acetyltransferase [Agrococcus sediminis]|jgi:amino-acid N-acetyltransferase|uniref:Amino-acid N-acetyltransferase n=1 Tax=Agrococcus sediminis TaxID=2599924 RepID=A0A5M8QLI0_9MICO|nr:MULTISPECIES: amino-acid N-acetyltransferase [Agrococcus]KAA6435142.1 amino-acid N-acetyltransferase [Agrococcus sediminis]MDR7233447.1 amino-acid N-acetyltransferase [Agrococcus sp. BE272]
MTVTSDASAPAPAALTVRRARTGDVRAMRDLIEPYVRRRILLGKELVTLYEAVQEFVVAERDGQIVGCGALHVLWEDLGEVRTIAVAEGALGKGVGHAMLVDLEQRARDLGLSRLFCLTFETEFFGRHGYEEVAEQVVSQDVFAELLRSLDGGVAEFLDLAHVKPNTLGNTRMLKRL